MARSWLTQSFQNSKGTKSAASQRKPSIPISVTHHFIASIIAWHISGLSKLKSATSSQSVPAGWMISPSSLWVYHSGCSASQALSQELWFATQSMMTLIPRRWHSAIVFLKSSTVPNSGFTPR